VYDEASSEGNKDPSASALARTYSPVSQEILFPLTPGCFFGTDAADAGTSELTPLANSCSSASTSWFFLCRSAWVAAHAGCADHCTGGDLQVTTHMFARVMYVCAAYTCLRLMDLHKVTGMRREARAC